MHRVIDISLNGHPEPFRLHDDAYDALTRYIDRARSRLADDPDRDDVIADLELSIGEKLTTRLSASKSVIDIHDMHAVLEQVGAVAVAVDADANAHPPTPLQRPRARRRLYRIKEGQEWAGVCTGLAAYAEIDVSAVRWILCLLGILTAGGLLLVYLAAVFILPVVDTREEYFAALEARELAEGLRPHR